MKNIDWNNVQDDVRHPVPGGYAAKITNVTDFEDKEYLRIEWEFADGAFKGANMETFTAFNFWPLAFVRSYKDTALRFFKGFKTAVEESNPNYVFKNDPQSLVGKYVGVVLGEEEYLSSKGTVKKRLYVDKVLSGKSIRDGKFKIPAFKPLDQSKYSVPATGFNSSFVELDSTEEVPF